MPSEHRLIGIMADPGLQLLTGMMGILRSGRAFVPIDAKFPVDRIGVIVRDCGLEVLVTQGKWLELARQVAEACPSLKHVVCLDRIEGGTENQAGGVLVHDVRGYLSGPAPEAARRDRATPQGLVYVIYTSGSTGAPKGVPISNENLIPILLWSREYFGLGEHTRVLQNLSYCFDFGVFELLTTMLFGGTLYFTDRREVSGVGFYGDFIRRNRIDTVHTTPSYFRDVLALDGGLETLGTVHLGGEPLSRSAVEQIYRAVREDCAVYNGYGPTEASVNATIFCLKTKHQLERLKAGTVPIGRPTADNRVFVLDMDMHPVAEGVPGELYIGGPGVARGYLSRPSLTATRFLPDPLSAQPGARLYRTGDLVRFVDDGDIEFLGRMDEQVKLRGFRIELGELEAALLTHPDVADAAAVVADADAGKRLVAFVVLKPQAAADSDARLRTYLRERLPEYMVPALIVPQPRLPLNPNGKADRRLLLRLAADAAPARSATAATQARSPAEELVAAAWAEVLGVDAIGAEDNFFELGGHSLLATQVISRLRHSFGSDLPLYLLFERPTLADFARHLESASWSGAAAQVPAIVQAPRDADLPLSFPQERLWFLNRLEPGSTAYLITRAIRIEGSLDHAVLEQTFAELVRRHEILRTTFPMVDGRPLQRIHPPYEFRIPVIDLSGVEEDGARREEVERLILYEGQRPFDLERLPLLRVNVVRLSDDKHVVILNEHHLIHDGWAQGVLVREFLALYRAFADGEPSPLPPLRLQFADFAHWQRSWMQSEQLQRQLRYWQEQLKGADGGLNLLTDRPRRSVAIPRGDQYEFAIPAELSAQLRDFSRREGVTLFMTMLAGFNALLHHYTGQVDISLGSGIANRRSQEFEDLLGMMVNTVVLRTDLSGAPSFRELLERVRKVCLGAYSHQDVPFDKVVEVLRPQRNRGHSPLFQAMFAFMDAPTRELSLPNLSLSVIETHNRSAKFDFTVIVLPHVEQLAGQPGQRAPVEISVQFEYNAEIFDASTVVRMCERYLRILRAVVSDPELRLGELPLMDDGERQRTLHGHNPERAPLADPELCAHQLVERQALLDPDAVAACDEHQALSYAQLNSRANRLAHHLIRLGIVAEDKVAICLPRSIESLVAALACFKAGAVYVALDPASPRQRLQDMVEDSGARIVLTMAALAERFDAARIRVIGLDADWPQIQQHSERDPEITVVPSQLAYVIYTSGSSGVPKGVAVEHRGLMNLIDWHRRAYALTPMDRATMLAGPGFDASFWEVWPYLAAGASVHIPGDEERNSPARLLRWLTAQKATLCFLPTPLAVAVLNEPWPEAIALRALLTGGDKLLCRPPAGRATQLFNHYGPTEYSVVATGCEVTPQGEPEVPPIGRPIANTRIYVLDARMQPVPQGLPGELCIAGAGLARGYLARPALTAERFAPDPFSTEAGARLYRSGDLVRLREDGQIEFLGRFDRQVKLRGFRIELEEIEAAAVAHPALRDVAVIVREDGPGGACLVAYVVPRQSHALSSADLRAHLKQRLPHYMVPAALVMLDSLPLSPNGKVDRRALPPPVWSGGEGSPDSSPRTPVEEAVAGIWSAVLGVARVGRHDDFFALGGHSLIAIRVAMRINQTFGVELPLRDLFEAPTVAELAERIGHLGGADADRETQPIARLPRDRPLPLSFAQQRLWFLDQLEPGKVNYNIPVAVRLSGRLDVEALERSIGAIIERHEVLRSTFVSAAGQPLQSVAPPGEWRLQRRELDEVEQSRREAEVVRLAQEEAARPFDLSRDPLLRGVLWRLSDDEHALLLTTHHIVFDGWSAGVLVQELSSLYLAFSCGEASPLPGLPVQYADFAHWQRERLGADWCAPHLAYWRQRLRGPLPVLQLPAAGRRDTAAPPRAAIERIRFPKAVYAAFQRFNRERGVTPFMTLLAALQALLHRYTGLDDIVIGTPIAGRTHIDAEPLIGFFANTLVLRGDLSGDPSFAALLERARDATLEGHAHGEIPFEMLVQELQPERNLDRTPLFQVMLVVQGMARATELPGLSVRPLPLQSAQAKFDLTLSLGEDGEGMAGHWEYDAARVDGAAVARMASHLIALLERAIAAPDAPVSRLDMLSPQELRRVTVDWNDTASDYPDACIHELFAAQAVRTPEAIALIDGEQRLSYRELNQRANRLARQLRARGVGPETIVGVLLQRTATLAVALLGALKAGAAYLPLDPEYPMARLAMMVEDAKPEVVLTQNSLYAVSEGLHADVVCLDDAGFAAATHADDDFDSGARGGNLAYVLYTSGSTGRPKGVAVEHRSAAAFIHWARTRFSREQLAGVLASTSICFDLSVFELFVPLASGGCVVLAQDALALATLAAADEVTLINTVPSALTELIRLGAIGEGVRAINLAGEPLHNALAQRAYAHHGVRQVMNLYGPSEDTTYSTCVVVERGATEAPTIGRPIANTRAYILDAALQAVPPGVCGELYLGGAGLARGYLLRPALTAERFVPDPLSGAAGARLYRTGDLARFREDGEIEFLGRCDRQIKLRGFRIELPEIEAALSAHPAVADAAAIVRDDAAGEAAIVACFVAAGTVPAAAELRAHLKRVLPHYMVPAAFVALDALPLSPNGKVDRQALSALAAPDIGSAADAVAPRDAVEQAVAAIWASLLGVERVGVHDDFFDLGGHSLVATRVVSRINETFHIELPLRCAFEAPTVEELAMRIQALIGSGAGRHAPPIERLPRGTPLPLSFSQQRLWFLSQFEGASHAYRIAGGVRLSGTLDRVALRGALDAVMARHEALRTTFAQSQGQPVQIVAALGRGFPLQETDLRQEADPHAALQDFARSEAGVPFDLKQGPLVRARLLQLAEDDHALLLTMHHIISDGWSMGVFVNDLGAFYQALRDGETAALPELPIQYADYAAWQRQWLSGAVLEQQAAYWKQALSAAPALLELPTDRARPAEQDYAGDSVRVDLDQALAGRLRALARRHGTTLYVALLAGWAALLARLSGQDDLVVGAPVANRTRTELEPLIGFCANTVALRLDVSGAPTVAELLRRAAAATLQAQQHQDIPFEQVVEIVQPARSLAHAPIFQVMFAWQNAPEGRTDLPELRIAPIEMPRVSSIFDMTLSLRDTGTCITGALEYATALFDQRTVDRYLGYWRTLLQALAEDETMAVGRLPLLAQAQRRQVLEQWSTGPTMAGDALPECAHAAFERQVARCPAAVALRHRDRQLSYAQLDVRANQLAHHLRGLGVVPDAGVAICMERGTETIVALLATLKAGGACIPLDASYPAERLAYVLEDSAPTAILIHAQTPPAVRALLEARPAGAAVVDLDEQRERWADAPGTPPDRAAMGLSAQHLAYVIYTSGSTGRPKGVAMSHAALVNLIGWQTAQAHDTAPTRCLQFAALGFDVAFQEIFSTLAAGAEMDLIDDAVRRDFPELLRHVCERGIERLFLPYAALQALAEAASAALADLQLKLKEVITAGEQLHITPQIAAFFARADGCRLHNHYGPTETHVATIYELPAEVAGWPNLPPIGRPVANSSAYVLDRDGQPVPAGVVGEIHLAGRQLARGYRNKPAQTAERFVPNPFGDEPGARLYRTGDLGRWRSDGQLDYLGRADRQIKLRGFRIELEEIESALLAHPDVADAAVVVDETVSADRGKRLIGFVVARDGAGFDEAGFDHAAAPAAQESGATGALRPFLRARLPDYMVPAVTVPIAALPLTPNGKIDRTLLARWAAQAGQAGQARATASAVPAMTPMEKLVAAAWEEVLGPCDIGPGDNFFDLGGHSLSASRMISRLREVLRIQLPVKRVFQHPTVTELAAWLERQQRSDAQPVPPPIRKAPRDEDVPLSFAQQRLWIDHRLAPASAAYNMPAAMRIHGPLDAAAFAKTIGMLFQRHEVLRTVFVLKNDRPIQRVGAVPDTAFQIEDLSDLPAPEQAQRAEELAAREATAPFDLSAGPLLRVKLLRLSEIEHVALMTAHHIVCDGWSVELMKQEIGQLYQAFAGGEQPRLPALPVQYADYARWQREQMRGDYAQALLDYWRRTLGGASAARELPTDRPRTAAPDLRGDYRHFALPLDLARGLRQLSRQEGATLFMTLLAAFDVLLARYTHGSDIVVGSAIAGRGPIEVERLIGCFVNMLVLRTDLSGDPRFRELLARVKETSLGAYAHQDLPFDLLVDELKPERRPGRSPFFQVAFGLQNQHKLSIDAAGLRLSPYPVKSEAVRYDLTVWVYEDADALEVKWTYRSDLFDAQTIERLQAHYASLLRSALADPDARISSLEMRSDAERERMAPEQSGARQEQLSRTRRKPIAVPAIGQENRS